MSGLVGNQILTKRRNFIVYNITEATNLGHSNLGNTTISHPFYSPPLNATSGKAAKLL
jgi:hypothetical protein